MMSFVKRRWFHRTAALLLALGATAETRADDVVYATADNGTTNLFGTMDLTTGQFTQIATTTPLFGSITVGAGGTLYGGEGNLNYNLDTVSPTGVTSQFGSATAPSDSFGFTGLASAGAAGFYAIYQTGALPGPFSATLEHISADGNSSSVVGTLSTSFWSFDSGNLAFGPDGNLYFNVWPTPSNVATLYQVNTTTGAATAVGSGLGTTDPLPWYPSDQRCMASTPSSLPIRRSLRSTRPQAGRPRSAPLPACRRDTPSIRSPAYRSPPRSPSSAPARMS